MAHEEIDLANPASNHMNAGFTDDERNKMTELLSDGFTDSFRYLHQDKKDAYSWWSYFAKSRERNIGWRIDYFLVSDILQPRIKAAEIHSSIWAVTTARWNWILKSKIYLQDSNYLYHSERRNLNDECTHRGR